jgi:hypothetical protein
MPEAYDSPSSQRALVPLVRQSQVESHARPMRQAASFVTQLIATARGLPQTRERRRAEPADVIAAYQATIAKLQKLNAQ